MNRLFRKLALATVIVGCIYVMVVVFSDTIWGKRLLLKYGPHSKKAYFMGKATDVFYSLCTTGATKADVLAGVGAPHNEDNENVWLWIDDFCRVVQSKSVTNWQEMATLSDGFFIIFKEGRIVYGPMSLSASDPKAALSRVLSNDVLRKGATN